MKKRIISLILTFVLTVSVFAGCGTQKTTVKNNAAKQESKPQLVVAMNPILAYDNGSNIIAFNDIKNAMSADQKAATLTSLANVTDWVWAYKLNEDWKKRGIYGLEKWRNGGNISADKLSADSFLNDGTVSLMVMRCPSKIRTLLLFPTIFTGKHVKATKVVTVFKGHHIRVRFDRPTALQIDGEVFSDVREYTVTTAAAERGRNGSAESKAFETV